MQAKYYHVQGRVQGVFYRRFTQQAAHQLGLDGWVKNEDDGSVTAYAFGSTEQLEAFEKALSNGPVAARVDKIEVKDAAIETLEGFEIRR